MVHEHLDLMNPANLIMAGFLCLDELNYFVNNMNKEARYSINQALYTC